MASTAQTLTSTRSVEGRIDLADDVLGDVGRDPRGLFRPAHPDEAGGGEQRAEAQEAVLHVGARGDEDMGGVDRRGRGGEMVEHQALALDLVADASGMSSHQARMPSFSDSFLASGVPE